MPTQNIVWTCLPYGVAGGRARFSVLIAPRLHTDGADGELRDFPDFTDWPATLRGITFRIHLPETGARPATVVSAPDSARWNALFSPATAVRGHRFTGAQTRRIRSYPVGHVLPFVRDRWGRFGTQSALEPPTYEDLAAADGFGPIGFEELDPESRKYSRYPKRDRLAGELETELSQRRAIGWDPAGAADADGLAKAFLQVDRFFQRGRARTTPEPPRRDFHDIVAMTHQYTRLTRLLGLVLDLEVTDRAVLEVLTGATGADPQSWATVRVDWTPALTMAAGANVLPRTRTRIGDGRFAPAPRSAAGSDMRDGLLKVGDPARFTTVALDPDTAALLSRQFADTVTRSRYRIPGQGKVKRSLASPDRFALPALRTSGLSVARLGRAAGLAEALTRAADTNATLFDSRGVPKAGTVDLYLEDLVRGERWDVLDTAGSAWRSLMQRTGRYRLGIEQLVTEVTEEGHVSVAPTGSTDPADRDLYLAEHLMRWSGWSLVVDRVGRVRRDDGTYQDPTVEPDKDFPVGLDLAVPRGSLPRLRFGHTYQLRARVVDLAGNAAAFTTADLSPNAPEFKTAPVTYRRFEPVPAPDVLLRTPHTAGESVERMVIRSVTGADTTATSAQRHILPPRGPQLLAESHGLLDGDGAGRPLRREVRDMLARRDAAQVEDLEVARREPAPHEDSWYFDTDSLPVPYLPDPLCREVVVRDLPGGGGRRTVPAVDGWPTAQSLRLTVTRGSTAGHELAGRELRIRLAPGDLYRLRLSSRFGAADLDVLGVWQLIEQWCAEHGETALLEQARAAAVAGHHPMLSPYREIVVVHAVLTPLSAPDLAGLTVADRPGGSSVQQFGGTVAISRKSTGTLDIAARWMMPVDGGPGAPRPHEQEFRATPVAVKVDRAAGADPGPDALPLAARYDFGDTRYRKVSLQATATSAFVEYFRTGSVVRLVDGQVRLDGIDPGSLKVRAVDGRLLTAAAPGDAKAEEAGGDYLFQPNDNLLRRTGGSSVAKDAELIVSTVPVEIHRTSADREVIIRSTARPAPPVVRYVVPLFKWTRTADGAARTSERQGNALRIYLERPWYGSGPEEMLGVVTLASGVGEPPAALAEHVTLWGADPAVSTPVNLPTVPDVWSFPLATHRVDSLAELVEVPGTPVSVAAHPVTFDERVGLWYCDVAVRAPSGEPLLSWFPFLRLGLVRYQHHAIAGCRLSTLVPATMVQLAPHRLVTVAGTGGSRTVSVSGAVYSATSGGTGTSLVRARVERRGALADPELGWRPESGPVDLALQAGAGPERTWQGRVSLPGGATSRRVVVEEIERHQDGTERTVYFDSVRL